MGWGKPKTPKEVQQQIRKLKKGAPKNVQGLIEKHAAKIKPDMRMTEVEKLRRTLDEKLAGMVKDAKKAVDKNEAARLRNQNRREHDRLVQQRLTEIERDYYKHMEWLNRHRR